MKYENVELSKREQQIMLSGFGLGCLFVSILVAVTMVFIPL